MTQAIAAKVRGAIWSFEIDFRPLAEAWEAAVAELDAALDQRFGPGLGLVVAMVENFHTLARNLFGGSAVTQKKTASAKAIEQSAAGQLLRKLMNPQKFASDADRFRHRHGEPRLRAPAVPSLQGRGFACLDPR